MKQLVLLKEGEYRANVFSDLVEVVNNEETSATDREKIKFFARSDFGYRVHVNSTSTNNEGALALATYLGDPHSEDNLPQTFRPVNIELMREALDTHDWVLFASFTDDFLADENDIIGNAKYIVRDDKGSLLDFETKERVFPGGTDGVNAVMKDSVVFFGLVKASELPVYYLIVDSSLVHIGDGFDYHDKATDVVFRKITDHDGTVKENIFVPSFSDGITQVGKYNLYFDHTVGDELTISFFDNDNSIIKSNDLTDVVADLDIEVESNLSYNVVGNSIVLSLDNFKENDSVEPLGYIRVTFKLGAFFNNVQRKEQPSFEWNITKV